MKKLRLIAILVGLTAVVLPFQNCSVYQSEGKKFMANLSPEDFLDGRDGGSSDSSSNSGGNLSLGKFTSSDCSPYIDAFFAESLFGAVVEMKMYYSQSNQKLSCLISALSDSESGLDTVVCSTSSEDLNLLQLGTTNSLSDPHTDGALNGGSYGFVSETSSGTSLHFLGSESGSQTAAHCTYTFASKSEYQSVATEALQRASRLVHHMAPSLR